MIIIDIIFQSGDFYSNSAAANRILGISIDTIFTTSITISVFIAGYITKKIYDDSVRKKGLKETSEYFCTLIELLNKPIERQINGFVDFAHHLKRKGKEDYQLLTVSGFNVENIKQVKHQDLYEIFFRDRKLNVQEITKDFQTFQENLSLMESINQSYKNVFNNFMQRYYELLKEWNTNMKAIHNTFNEIANSKLKQGLKKGDDPFFEKLDLLLAHYQSNSDYQNEHEGINILINPLRKLCSENLTHPNSPQILSFGTNCLIAYKNIEKGNNMTRRYYITTARQLNTARYHLNCVIEKLKHSNSSKNVHSENASISQTLGI